MFDFVHVSSVADILCFPSLPIDVLSLGYAMDELDEQWLPMVKSWRLNEVRSTMDSNSLKRLHVHHSSLILSTLTSHTRTFVH